MLTGTVRLEEHLCMGSFDQRMIHMLNKSLKNIYNKHCLYNIL